MNKKLPFRVRITNVSEINPRAGIQKGGEYDVYEETREGYKIWSDNFGMAIEIYFNECEKIVPENVNGKDN